MRTRMMSDKPLLLVFPYNVMAHYLRCLELAKYLKPYYTIKFLHSHNYYAFVAEAEFETFECASLDADKVQQCVTLFNFSWLNEGDLSHIYQQQVRIINESGAKAVLGDMAPTLKMAAEKTGVTYYSLVNGYLSKHYSYVRRMPKSYPLYKFFNLLPNSLYTYFTNIGEHLYFHDIHKPFNKIRKREKLPVKHSYIQELEGDVNLICDLPELFPQRDLPFNYYHIPPLFHSSNNKSENINTKLNSNKKTLYVCMGSTGNWSKVAFLNDPNYKKYNIVTAGDEQQIIKGSNVISYTFISDQSFLEKVDLVICHGGNGTTYQALSFGIPVLCKTSHLEQEYNVDGIERLNVGRSLDDKSGEDCFALIEEWTKKKTSPELKFISKKIQDSRDQFEFVIEKIVSTKAQSTTKELMDGL